MKDLKEDELMTIEGGGWLCELESAIEDAWEDTKEYFDDLGYALKHQGILGGNAPL